MSWFSNDNKDVSRIKSEIRDLEREYDSLQSQIKDANSKWWDCRRNNEKWHEADYWSNLENDYINKQYYVKEKIRDLERQL